MVTLLDRVSGKYGISYSYRDLQFAVVAKARSFV